MKKIIIILMFMFLNSVGYSQHYFLGNKNTNLYDRPLYCLNDTVNNRYVISTSHVDLAKDLFYSKIFSLDYNGNIIDSIVKTGIIDSFNTYDYIFQSSDTTYTIIGKKYPVHNNNIYTAKLFYTKVNFMLQPIVEKIISIDTLSSFHPFYFSTLSSKNRILITGSGNLPSFFNNTYGHAFIAELDFEGNVLKNKVYIDSSFSFISSIMERKDNPDLGFVIYQDGGPLFNYKDIVLLDTNYNYLNGILGQSVMTQVVFTASDYSYLYPIGTHSFLEVRTDGWTNKQRDYILKYNYDLLYKSKTRMPESIDTTGDDAHRKAIKNSIAIDKNYNIYSLDVNRQWDLYSTVNNQIIVCKMDSSFNKSWVRYFGGDAVYVPIEISYLKNGCMVMCTREVMGDTVNKTEMIIFSLDSLGTVTSLINFTNPTKLTYQCYPNPASNKVNFIVDNHLLNGQLSIFDINGGIIKKEQLNNSETEIDISLLPIGNYFYEIVNKKGEKANGKFSKN